MQLKKKKPHFCVLALFNIGHIGLKRSTEMLWLDNNAIILSSIFFPFLDTLPVFANDLQTKPSAPHSTKTKLAVNDGWNESKD